MDPVQKATLAFGLFVTLAALMMAALHGSRWHGAVGDHRLAGPASAAWPHGGPFPEHRPGRGAL